MSANMYDLGDWQAVPCLLADLIRQHQEVRPHSSLTDIDGTYGKPVVFTEWGVTLQSGTDAAVLREYRWPDDPDRICEHYVQRVASIDDAFDPEENR